MKIAFRRRIFHSIGRILILLIILTTCDFLNQDNDFEPTGTSYTLNSNIELIRIQESRLNYNPTGLFSLDFICHSKSSRTETATLPAGLFFICQNSKVQSMIIVKDFGVSVSSAEDTFTLGAFSVNESKSVPGDSEFYNIGPITDNSDLKKIIDIVKGKVLSASNVLTVQHAIDQVTSEDSLGVVMIDSLGNLPDSIPAFLAKKPARLIP